MKKLMIALMLTAVSVASQAQKTTAHDERTPEERAKARTERMTKELGLNTDQTMRVEALNRKYAEEAAVLRAQEKADREKRRAAFKDRHTAYDADLKSMLTTDQYAKWTAKKEEMKAKHRDKRKAMHEAGREQRKAAPAEPKQ